MEDPNARIALADRIGPGTQLVVSRRGYRHHGVYVGGGRVIHYAGRLSYPRGLVEDIPLAEFIEGRRCEIGRSPADSSSGDEVVRRARSRLGEQAYDVLRNNCEHFCNWCLVGEPRSVQVESLPWPLRLVVRRAEGLALLLMGVNGAEVRP